MRIAFYAPLKSPEHPVPSGDRLMAGQLRASMIRAGHEVVLASELRAYCGNPEDQQTAQRIATAAMTERRRIATEWRTGAPDIWVSYHPYYKSPDLIGPPLCRRFGLPYVTIESSYSQRRNLGVWIASQSAVLEGCRDAAVNICLTRRDRDGILAAIPEARVADLPPFIDPAAFLGARTRSDGPVRLITVAMMRAGDKLDSYAMLAEALAGLGAADWRLTIVGAGPMESEVRAMFAGLANRVEWAGLCDHPRLAALLGRSDIYLWPGFGEAYGLAYLEAQAAGLPVVAQRTAGVPEVVGDDVGLLAPAGDVAGYRSAVAALIRDAGLRERLGKAARTRVLERHSIDAATARLHRILVDIAEARR